MNLRTGVDLIDISRVREAIERHGERFLARVFTETERRDSKDNFASLAARFAAKEAAAKALGCGFGPIGWLEVEVRSDESRMPHLVLHGRAEKLADELGLSKWSVSLSHTESQAIAFVVAVSENPPD
jgi:holo-[acyl-carrier protein] synthase